MNEAPHTGLLFDDPAAEARFADALRRQGIAVSRVRVCDQGVEPPVHVLLVEERRGGLEAAARIRALVSANKHVLVVACVPDGRFDERLFEAGAFDIVEAGPGLDRATMRMVATARRFLRLEQSRARLSNDLAHQDRMTALGLLAAGVGHEVNNPAAAILANLELMRDQLESILSRPRYQQAEFLNEHASDWLEALGDCLGASRRITSIVRSLNAFSRKGDVGEPALVDMNDEIATVLRLIGKEVHFQTHVDLQLEPALPPVWAMPHAMTQVITNLVVNALQALEAKPREERRLVVRTAHDDETVMVEVSDNGPGIPAAHLGRIFDPFFTTKPTGVGTGLGLAITREIIQKAGGEILVESTPGNGATFRIVFERPHAASFAPERPSRMPPARERLRVLVVDDDDLLLRSMKRLLDGQFEVVAARSSEDALGLLGEDDAIDVVLTDIVMPGASGVDFYDELYSRHPQLARRTIFISGGVRSEEIRRRIEVTGRPFVSKPIEVQELTKLVRAVERDIAA